MESTSSTPSAAVLDQPSNLKPIIREKGLGILSVIPDSGIIELIIPYLSKSEICQVALVSKTFLVLSEDDKLWRQLVLNEFEGNFWYQFCWKYTYIHTWYAKHRPNVECPYKGYTSTLYTRWSRSGYEMNQFEIPFSHIQRISADSITYEEFLERYAKFQVPVIITGALNTWKAMENWKFDKFLDKYGEVEFKTDQAVSHLYPHYSELYQQYLQDKKEGKDLSKYDNERRQGNIKIKFRNYYHYMHNNKDENPIYIFDSKFGERDSRLVDEYEVPQFFKEDFFEQCLDAEERPLFRWIVIGPARSGTQFHMDPYLTSAWNALICGRKRWLFYPLNHVSEDLEEAIEEMKHAEQEMIKERLMFEKQVKTQLLHEGKIGKIYEDEFEIKDSNKPIPSYVPCSEPLEWLTDEYYTAINQGRRPWECIQYPGDLIFVPSGWWHMVLNLDDTMAVTQNFCDTSNVHLVYADVIKRNPRMAKLLRRGLARIGKIDLIKPYISEEEYQDAITKAHEKDPMK
ncbi:hypothetical protein C9374_001588 [Naegleria lovaniensis]|uniref:JmjC domain-containing protein n=1 Tax=Naegleria lovaniensis TaxID=51637 RepID=A0AA88GRU7_NAELO|nr:uncharacterized protein C9374_001588 [Naegleria lovaniensis]KAG2387256.1 hypothetical protein C9374_001588 [Naegleria lovaniensis]